MELIIVSGFVVFLPKYLETQFSLGKSQASVFTGNNLASTAYRTFKIICHYRIYCNPRCVHRHIYGWLDIEEDGAEAEGRNSICANCQLYLPIVLCLVIFSWV